MHNIYERELTVQKSLGMHCLNYLVVVFNDYIARFYIIGRPGVDQLIKSSSFHTSLFWSSLLDVYVFSMTRVNMVMAVNSFAQPAYYS